MKNPKPNLSKPMLQFCMGIRRKNASQVLGRGLEASKGPDVGGCAIRVFDQYDEFSKAIEWHNQGNESDAIVK